MNSAVAMFGAHNYEKAVFDKANVNHKFAIRYLAVNLNFDTAPLAQGYKVLCCFVNDHLDAKTIRQLAKFGVELIALRCAGFNNVDLTECERLGIRVVRVPEYSPYAIAEHAMALILSLNRKIHHAYMRIKQLNFSLEGLVGFDLHGKTIGVVGTGKIGAAFARIAHGFGCKVLASDLYHNQELLAEKLVSYVELNDLLEESDIVSLHVPLTPDTFHLIDARAMVKMKSSALLINTSRGALVDSSALIKALKSSSIAGAGLDVYEEEAGIFFQDLSDRVLQDDILARLTTFPNVLMTSHQGFLTEEALQNIASTTLENIRDFIAGNELVNEVKAEKVMATITS